MKRMHSMAAIVSLAAAMAIGSPEAAYSQASHPMHGQGTTMGPGMMGSGSMPCAAMAGPMSMMGHGMMGMGPGMMGQGMMGHEMMGPGMMGMGPGMMGQGMMGHGMGPGMMGMGPGMMGQGMMGPYGGMMMGPMMGMAQLPAALTADDVRANLERWLAWRGNPRLKLGNVSEKDAVTVAAEIVTIDGSLVETFEVDRRNGMIWPVR